MASYKLLKEVLEKLEDFEDAQTDKTLLNLDEFTAYLAGNNIKLFESVILDAGDKSSKEKDIRLEMEKNPTNIESLIGQLIVFMNRYSKQYTKKALKNSEIKTIDEFSYLAMLLNFGHLSKIDLINKNIQEKTTGIETINRLLKNELLHQEDNPNDKRSQLLSLTKKGQAVLFSVFDNMQMVSSIITGNLTLSEKIQLASLLKKLDLFHHDIYTNKMDEPLEKLIPKDQ
jgi:DNA-binding MarR family transcriptional regulator